MPTMTTVRPAQKEADAVGADAAAAVAVARGPAKP
jgi:hypothetical protein